MKQNNFLKGFISGVLALLFVGAVVFAVGSARRQGGGTGLDLDPVFEKMQKIQAQIDNRFYFGGDSEQDEDYIYYGMVAGLGDVYSQYMTPEQYRTWKRASDGNYVGIGATVSQDPATLATSISAVTPGGPAEKAGLRAGDIFLAVDGEDVTQASLDELINDHTLGEEGTTVVVRVKRPDTGEELEFDVVREPIITQTVNHRMLDAETGYLQITEFDGVTPDQFKAAADDLIAQGAKRMVYDLRNNTGGNLNAVIDVLDYILPDGLIVYTEDRNGVKQKEYYGEDGHEINLPSVVLVNGKTASASEVFSSAMRDYGLAKLVGEQTFGKGIVQNFIELGDGSALKLTTTAYFTKNGTPIQGEGLAPDAVVEMKLPEDGKELPAPEDDVQLKAARELLDGEK